MTVQSNAELRLLSGLLPVSSVFEFSFQFFNFFQMINLLYYWAE